MTPIKEYIQENEARFMDELASLIRIPSVSSQPEHKADMAACAQRWKELLLAAGADEARVMPTEGNPIVFAQKTVNPQAKTVLVYAHYDVMPPEPLELWHTSPFEPVIKEGRIWARGADDDKGQSFLQVKAFEYTQPMLDKWLRQNGIDKKEMRALYQQLDTPELWKVYENLYERE